MPTYSVNYAGKTHSIERRADGKFIWPAGVPRTCPTSFADNVMTNGTGGLNIDGCRVGNEKRTFNQVGRERTGSTNGATHGGEGGGYNYKNEDVERTYAGRFPANLVFSHMPYCTDECAEGCPVAALDADSGVSKSNGAGTKCSKRDEQGNCEGHKNNDSLGGGIMRHGTNSEGLADQGGASRFFPSFKYQAKAPTKERPKVGGKAHPTVKPLTLMAWLVRLVTPPKGIVFDPFAGSGTTVQAALDEGFRAVGVEYAAEHIPLIQQRLEGYDVAYVTQETSP